MFVDNPSRRDGEKREKWDGEYVNTYDDDDDVINVDDDGLLF